MWVKKCLLCFVVVLSLLVGFGYVFMFCDKFFIVMIMFIFVDLMCQVVGDCVIVIFMVFLGVDFYIYELLLCDVWIVVYLRVVLLNYFMFEFYLVIKIIDFFLFMGFINVFLVEEV